MEYDSALKEKEVLPQATSESNLEDMMLKEQTLYDSIYMKYLK